METWLSYGLSDLLMFSPRVYYRQLELANASAWPIQVPIVIAGLVLAFAMHSPSNLLDRIGATILAAAWACTGWFFVINAYAQIHWAGWYMATLFFAQAAALALLALVAGGLKITTGHQSINWIRAAIVVLLVLGYPGLAALSERAPAQYEVFGVAADPTALVTVAAVAAGVTGWQLLLAIPPWLWLAFSASTLWAMGSPEVWIVLVFLVAAPAAILWRLLARRSSARLV